MRFKIYSQSMNVNAGTYAIQFNVVASDFNSTADYFVQTPSVLFEYLSSNVLVTEVVETRAKNASIELPGQKAAVLDMMEAADFASAVRRFRELADQGDAKGQSDLATMYQNGLGVPQNYAEALRLYRLAADQGNAFAQSNLGVMYASGQGVPQNYVEAANWYRRAADRGLAVAQHNLGFMYANGQGLQQNHAEAMRLYRLAADQGDANGQKKLGIMYANAQGVPHYVLAYMWTTLSAAQGDQDAAKNQELLAQRMTSKQV